MRGSAVLLITSMMMSASLSWAQDNKQSGSKPDSAKQSGGKPGDTATRPKPDEEPSHERRKEILRAKVKSVKDKKEELAKEAGKCPADIGKIDRLRKQIEVETEYLRIAIHLVIASEPEIRAVLREYDVHRRNAEKSPQDVELRRRSEEALTAARNIFDRAKRKLEAEVAAELGDANVEPKPAADCEPPTKPKNRFPSADAPYTPPRNQNGNVPKDELMSAPQVAPQGAFVGVGIREISGATEITERLKATGVATFATRPQGSSVAATAEFGYTWNLNARWFGAVAVAATVADLRNAHNFAGGTSLASTISSYAALTGQIGYRVTPSTALFVEVGGAVARQTLSATFAPGFSETGHVGGVVVGGGIKVRPTMFAPSVANRVTLTARYNYMVLDTLNVSPPGLFGYAGRTQLHTFRAGVEFPL